MGTKDINGLQKGVSAEIHYKDKIIGQCGMLSSDLMCKTKSNPIGLFEIDTSIVYENFKIQKIIIPSTQPSVSRDVTLDVPKM